jgi:hypothetical protein
VREPYFCATAVLPRPLGPQLLSEDPDFLLKYLWQPRNTTYEGSHGKGARTTPLPGLFYLMVMVTGLEWLSEPDVPVTVTVT